MSQYQCTAQSVFTILLQGNFDVGRMYTDNYFHLSSARDWLSSKEFFWELLVESAVLQLRSHKYMTAKKSVHFFFWQYQELIIIFLRFFQGVICIDICIVYQV